MHAWNHMMGFSLHVVLSYSAKSKCGSETMIDQAMAVHMLAGSKNEEVRSQWLANEQLRRRNVLKYLKHNKSTAQV